jgi:hypothetical protein
VLNSCVHVWCSEDSCHGMLYFNLNRKNISYCQDEMRKCRLTVKERAFIQSIMDSVISKMQTRDMRKCCEYACRDIHSSSLAKRKLRVVVMTQIDSHGVLFFERLFKRYAPYKALPPPLRGKCLSAKAAELGLLQRTEWVRVDTATLKRECMMDPPGPKCT